MSLFQKFTNPLGLPYKSFTMNISQVGTNDPITIVSQSKPKRKGNLTISYTFRRISAGVYTSVDTFDPNIWFSATKVNNNDVPYILATKRGVNGEIIFTTNGVDGVLNVNLEVRIYNP